MHLHSFFCRCCFSFSLSRYKLLLKQLHIQAEALEFLDKDME